MGWCNCTGYLVSGNAVTQLAIEAGGSGYADGETLDIDNTFTGGSNAEVTISTTNISTIIGNTVQITGIGTTASNHYRVTGVPAINQVLLQSLILIPRLLLISILSMLVQRFKFSHLHLIV